MKSDKDYTDWEIKDTEIQIWRDVDFLHSFWEDLHTHTHRLFGTVLFKVLFECLFWILSLNPA